MERQLFVMNAQNVLDEFDEDIDDLKKLARKADENRKEHLKDAIEDCEEDMGLLIEQYNVITRCNDDTWDDKQASFINSRNALEHKIDSLTIKIKGMKKQDFKDKIKSNIDKTEAQIDKLKAEMSELSDEAKETYQSQINKLEKKKAEFESKYDELKDIADEKWEDAKDSFKSGMDSLRETMKHLFD